MKEQLLKFLKRKKVRMILVLGLLILLPISMAYLLCVQLWSSVNWNGGNANVELDDDEYMIHFSQEVTNNPCPARGGKELKDYWACLWASSITAEGIQQHEKFLWDDYLEQLDWEREVMERRYNASLKREGVQGGKHMSSNISRRRRVRRQADQKIPYDVFSYFRVYAFLSDSTYPLSFLGRLFDPSTVKKYKICMQEILPGVSIQKFLLCLRETAKTRPSYPILKEYGHSFEPTFQPSTYPPMNHSDYDEKYFKLVQMIDNRTGTKYEFSLDFKPLGDEEQLSNFHGADPYLDDDWSVYRYKYDTMNSRQKQPGWSYGGKDSPDEWHKLNVERFYLPVLKSADLTNVAYVADLAQTYPGVGEIVKEKKHLTTTPLDYRWSKDSGYSVYTRFLLPLLLSENVEYYKSKHLLPSETKVVPDKEQIQDIIDALDDFHNSSDDYFVNIYSVNKVKNPKFLDSEGNPWPDSQLPNAEAYKSFLSEFFNVDIGKLRAAEKSVHDKLGSTTNADPSLYLEFELARRLLREYVYVVKIQEECLKILVEKDYRVDDKNELERLINKAKNMNETCRTAKNKEEAVEPKRDAAGNPFVKDFAYKVTEENLRKLYDYYFNRKEARQRYTLPKIPIEFPICKHNEPSPIDIKTHRGRKSSLQDYVYGDAAYRLNRFFMFFPLDGSPLLTVGIVDGKRLDGSSVRLTGGAVKGQNLTFQYMHIRYSSSWKRVGSEHWIDGKGAPMELQMVFTIAGSADPIKYWHVLARVQNQLFQFREKLVIIISVLVDVLASDEDVIKKIEEEGLKQDPYFMEPLAQAAYHFRSIPAKNPTYEHPRGYVSLDPVFRFIDFTPRKTSKFYTYRGSLSWPPCFGYVIWSVYQQRLYISKRQFDQFRKIPAYGIQDDNWSSDNIRKFDDVYVEEEDDPSLSYTQIEELKRLRTIDRHVLIGIHKISDDEREEEKEGIVSPEEYYDTEEENKSTDLRGGIIVMPLTMLMAVAIVLNIL